MLKTVTLFRGQLKGPWELCVAHGDLKYAFSQQPVFVHVLYHVKVRPHVTAGKVTAIDVFLDMPHAQVKVGFAIIAGVYGVGVHFKGRMVVAEPAYQAAWILSPKMIHMMLNPVCLIVSRKYGSAVQKPAELSPQMVAVGVAAKWSSVKPREPPIAGLLGRRRAPTQ